MTDIDCVIARLDIEGLTLDSQYILLARAEFLEKSITFSQEHVHGRVDMMVYKGAAHILARPAPESNLYSEEEASMDSLDGFDVTDTTGFFAIQGIQLKKYGAARMRRGEPLTRE
ncbi:hypothetical protein GGR57DRAFT_507015 [Xylariaceae sp. FL1272]|nr:hypothetical protein GGR57DRAFT_507015 [Xylariaceae sp. FL1272]